MSVNAQSEAKLLVWSGLAPAAALGKKLQYLALRAALAMLGGLPRSLSRRVGAAVGAAAFFLGRRLRSVGRQNLMLALPEIDRNRREAILRAEYRQLGHLLAEFAQMSGYGVAQAASFIRYDGLDRYLKALAKGRGVLVLTAHLGAWELSSYFHSLMGFPMGTVIRRLDNPLVDRYVNAIRCKHGNRVLPKDDFARSLLAEMKAGRTVGILMDTNMTPPQGTFVPFFGIPACTASGMARIARNTGAAVLPGFLLEQPGGRYVLHFGEEISVEKTGDSDFDAETNTARFTAVLEQYIRRYPEQWLWMHRRWKTRPPGDAKIYV